MRRLCHKPFGGFPSNLAEVSVLFQKNLVLKKLVLKKLEEIVAQNCNMSLKNVTCLFLAAEEVFNFRCLIFLRRCAGQNCIYNIVISAIVNDRNIEPFTKVEQFFNATLEPFLS